MRENSNGRTRIDDLLSELSGEPRERAPARRQELATYDRLGQTLVATITASTLSGAEAAELNDELLLRIASGDSGPARHVVLDLGNVEHMDSTCIGVFVELLTKLQEAGGRIALVNAAHNVEYLFRLTRLDRLFPICRDVMKAIEAVDRIG